MVCCMPNDGGGEGRKVPYHDDADSGLLNGRVCACDAPYWCFRPSTSTARQNGFS